MPICVTMNCYVIGNWHGYLNVIKDLVHSVLEHILITDQAKGQSE